VGRSEQNLGDGLNKGVLVRRPYQQICGSVGARVDGRVRVQGNDHSDRLDAEGARAADELKTVCRWNHDPRSAVPWNFEGSQILPAGSMD
jgi:hypothetical protein